MVKTPANCPICGSPWRGGHQIPPHQMTQGLRVFYECGASVSYKKIDDDTYQLLIKNCGGMYGSMPCIVE